MKNSVTGFLVYLCVVITTTYPMQKYTDPSIRSLARKIEKIALNTKRNTESPQEQLEKIEALKRSILQKQHSIYSCQELSTLSNLLVLLSQKEQFWRTDLWVREHFQNN